MHTLKSQGVDSLDDTGAVSAIEIYLGNIEIWDPEAKNNAQAENSECQIIKIVPFQISGKPSK